VIFALAHKATSRALLVKYRKVLRVCIKALCEVFHGTLLQLEELGVAFHGRLHFVAKQRPSFQKYGN